MSYNESTFPGNDHNLLTYWSKVNINNLASDTSLMTCPLKAAISCYLIFFNSSKEKKYYHNGQEFKTICSSNLCKKDIKDHLNIANSNKLLYWNNVMLDEGEDKWLFLEVALTD